MLGCESGARARQEQANPLPKIGVGAVCKQYRRCGKPGCRCARGELHGPYFCLFWRERGRLRKRYVPLSEVAVVEAACTARRDREREAWAVLRTWKQEWRDTQRLLRELEREGAWD